MVGDVGPTFPRHLVDLVVNVTSLKRSGYLTRPLSPCGIVVGHYYDQTLGVLKDVGERVQPTSRATGVRSGYVTGCLERVNIALPFDNHYVIAGHQSVNQSRHSVENSLDPVEAGTTSPRKVRPERLGFVASNFIERLVVHVCVVISVDQFHRGTSHDA